MLEQLRVDPHTDVHHWTVLVVIKLEVVLNLVSIKSVLFAELFFESGEVNFFAHTLDDQGGQ